MSYPRAAISTYALSRSYFRSEFNTGCNPLLGQLPLKLACPRFYSRFGDRWEMLRDRKYFHQTTKVPIKWEVALYCKRPFRFLKIQPGIHSLTLRTRLERPLLAFFNSPVRFERESNPINQLVRRVLKPLYRRVLRGPGTRICGAGWTWCGAGYEILLAGK